MRYYLVKTYLTFVYLRLTKHAQPSAAHYKKFNESNIFCNFVNYYGIE